jgi:hypothetical protein
MKEDGNKRDRIEESPHKVIGREAKWTALLLGFVGQQVTLNVLKDTLAPAIENVRQPGEAAVGDYFTILQVFWTSAPLVVACAIIYILLMKGMLRGGAGVIIAGLVLAGAAYIGNKLGFQHTNVPSYDLGFGLMVKMIESYFSAYGCITFVSSLIVGVFFGRACLVLER